MNKLQQRMQLLWLLSIYFIYRIIRASIENNNEELILWALFLIIYVISLVIMMFVLKNWQKRAKEEY